MRRTDLSPTRRLACLARAARVALVVLAAAGCSASSSSEGDEGASGEGAIIGGQPATVDRFPATLYLEAGCTATKVGPKLLLTAAHCVLDPATVSPTYERGGSVGLSRDPAKGFEPHGVAAVHVHPDWLKACDETYCGASETTARVDAPDVAVLELADELANVPAAPVDPSPLAAGDRVTILGFGCKAGVLAPDSRPAASPEFAETRVVAATAAIHPGSPLTSADLGVVDGNYALTPGPGLSPGNAGLCPGDSGGPLYRDTGEGLAVVGVNANYTFEPQDQDAKGLPVTNWHTRLDAKSRHGVAAWLRSVGVR